MLGFGPGARQGLGFCPVAAKAYTIYTVAGGREGRDAHPQPLRRLGLGTALGVLKAPHVHPALFWKGAGV